MPDAERVSFESLLLNEFRWPQPGDKPFVAASDKYANANVADNWFTRLVFMIDGYKIGADIMVKETIDTRNMRDILIFPIIFNYRQFIELSLKYQLAVYGPAVGVDPNWNTHELIGLWNSFIRMMELYGIEDPNETDPIVEEIITEFAKIDPYSFSYRYPVDKKGNILAIQYSMIYLPNLAQVMEAVQRYFSGCDGYLSSLEQ